LSVEADEIKRYFKYFPHPDEVHVPNNKLEDHAMDNKETRVLTVAEVGDRLKVGRNSAYELFNQRNFPSFRIGKSLRITEAAFEEWLKNQVK